MRFLATAFCAFTPLAPSHALAKCDGSLPHGPAGLPSRVLVQTSCGSYGIDPDGSVAPAAPIRDEPAPWRIANRRGHLVLIEHGRAVWRSRRTLFRSLEELDSIAVGPRDIAFDFVGDRRLWVARFGHAEHVVGRGEAAVAWTRRNELITLRWRARARPLYVRRENGGRRRLVARNVSYAVPEATGWVLLVTYDGVVARSEGHGIKWLANLQSYGLDLGNTWPDLLDGGLIAFMDRRHVVVLLPDGAPYASATFPAGLGWTAYPVAGHGGVAFVGIEPNGGENVYLLHPGDRTATVLYRSSASADGCHGAAVSWHGDWILYWALDGTTAALNSSGRHAPVELTNVIERLPGAQEAFFVRAAWA